MDDKGSARPMCSLLYSMMANRYDLFVGDQRCKMVGAVGLLWNVGFR